jgi:DNA helicase-2/ATP-dependent DNA helicase PcrA
MNTNIDSKYQLAIYEAQKDTTKNLAILATAGSGKTTTLLRLLQKVSRNRSGIFLSFSKAIIEELQSKIPSYIEAKTLHGYGFSLIRGYFRSTKIVVVNDKYFKNAVQIYKAAKEDKTSFLTKDEFRECKQIEAICSFARMTLTPFTSKSLQKMAVHYNAEFTPRVIEVSLTLLSKALIGQGKSMWIDFTDMIYLPAMTPAMFSTKFDDVYLDEAQDTNSAQRNMIELMIKPKGRLISVGDDFQCIYGFAGAGIDSFKILRERPNTVVLPLSVSYRLPISGVRKAQEICPNIEAWEGAIEGIEREGEWNEIKEGDFVLSRVTKPLIVLYFKLIREKIKANIVGKDIESGLLDFADLCITPTKEETVVKMNGRLNKYCEEMKKLGVRYPELTPAYASLEEKFQVMMIILDHVDNPNELIATIKKIFAEDKQAAKLMTVHRAKGLENDTVFVIDKVADEVMMPLKRATQDWELIQESNLMFVSRTRHRKELIWLNLSLPNS